VRSTTAAELPGRPAACALLRVLHLVPDLTHHLYHHQSSWGRWQKCYDIVAVQMSQHLLLQRHMLLQINMVGPCDPGLVAAQQVRETGGTGPVGCRVSHGACRQVWSQQQQQEEQRIEHHSHKASQYRPSCSRTGRQFSDFGEPRSAIPGSQAAGGSCGLGRTAVSAPPSCAGPVVTA